MPCELGEKGEAGPGHCQDLNLFGGPFYKDFCIVFGVYIGVPLFRETTTCIRTPNTQNMSTSNAAFLPHLPGGSRCPFAVAQCIFYPTLTGG